MLIAKVYVNKDKIDEIHIQNVGSVPGYADDLFRYKIRKPEGFDHLDLFHKRSSGYRPLLINALSLLCVE